jgi:hypothetical protein
MIAVRKYVIAGATFAVLLAGAIVIQNSGAVASLVGRSSGGEPFVFSPLPELRPEEARDPRFGPVLIAPDGAEAAIGLGFPSVGSDRTNRQEPMRLASIKLDLLPGAEAAAGCVPELLAEPGDGAIVDLALSAPCLPGASFVLHHQGMMFSGLTDEDGNADLTVPALSKSAVFVASFDLGPSALAAVQVNDIDRYGRAALMWEGNVGAQLHAREFAAPFGAPGYVWQEAPNAGAGVFAALGRRTISGGYFVQVYTFPVGASPATGEIEVSVEIPVTSENCGQEASAQSLQILPGKRAVANDLVVTMPGCEAKGDILALGAMYQTMAVAAR